MTVDKQLHIICFTVPYPPDYGGVFDLFFKIKALHAAGVRIYLHCFSTGDEQPVLKNYCEEVFYYKRKTGLGGISFTLPYIVSSRSSAKLARRLNQDNHPIFIEGIHSSGILNGQQINKRKIALRLHNIEHVYYSRLFSVSKSLIKRAYYKAEAALLAKYEARVIKEVKTVYAVSEADAEYCKKALDAAHVIHLPVFTDFQFSAKPGTGCFCLYHGNLDIAENESAVDWLLTHVFSSINIPLIVAGKNPSSQLARSISQYNNVSLISNPSNEVLNDLLSKSQCNVLPSHNATGIKLKIIHALYTGRHCIANSAAVSGSGVEDLCIIADDPLIFRKKVWEIYLQPLSSEILEKRKDALERIFNNELLAHELIRWLS